MRKLEKTILVTGGAGFIGSAYLNAMVPRYPQYFFVNLDALTYAADLKNLSIGSVPNYAFEKADIRDVKALKRLFAKYKPTHIVHFAAESHVDNSILKPRIFSETNVIGTMNLLDFARHNDIQRFHHISTDEVYGSIPLGKPPVSEDAPLRPSSPYSASKAASDGFVIAYHTTYGLDTVITRSSNNYGPGQHREKFIPLFIDSFRNGKKAPLYGSGKNIRDWMYVMDHVEGLDKALHFGKKGNIYNLGASNERKNIDIAKLLHRLVGNAKAGIEQVTDRLGHDMRYAIDSAKAKKNLKWKPRTAFEEGLKKTIKHYT